MNEEKLIALILAGEHNAFRKIVEEYSPAIRVFFAARLADPHTVDDLAQEVFIAAYEGLEGFASTKGNLENWIRGIARNRLKMHLRSLYRRSSRIDRLRQQIICDVAHPDKNDTSDEASQEQIRKLQRCLDRLPLHVRTVLEQRYHNSEPLDTIARRNDVSVPAVTSMLFRGRSWLRKCIEWRE